MAHHQQEGNRRHSAIQNLLNVFRLSNTLTVAGTAEDELAAEVDEPPDDQLSPLQTNCRHKDHMYNKSPTLPSNDRRESLLTRALMGVSNTDDHSPNSMFRGLSTTSTRSGASLASTAELTSDGNLTTPPRSATPSPPPPPAQYGPLRLTKANHLPPRKDVMTITNKEQNHDDKQADAKPDETNLEAKLGRKRRIMFACGGNAPEHVIETTNDLKTETKTTEPPKRKCMLTFACPSRDAKTKDLASEVLKKRYENAADDRKPSIDSIVSIEENRMSATTITQDESRSPISPRDEEHEATPFHEFADPNDEPDAWVNKPTDTQRKLTLTDCMMKENAIRQIGKEAEEEAEQEELENEELDEGVADEDEGNIEDDFAPSDGSSDAGNESDNEEGFADSDDESDAGSDYRFWAPSAATTALTSTENVHHIRPFSARRQSASSVESITRPDPVRHPSNDSLMSSKRHASRIAKMRPSTPELPDSTDFVCGTLDEDRPLEAAYISCREQKKREKYIPIPQDIDPSFPTTDPEDAAGNEDNEIGTADDDHLWLKDQLDGFEDETNRGGRGKAPVKKSPIHSPGRLHSPPPRNRIPRPIPTKHTSHRSPPPKNVVHRSPPPKHQVLRSPPPTKLINHHAPIPRRLFGHSPTRPSSPFVLPKMHSPPGTRRSSPAGSFVGPRPSLGLTVTRLAQRPNMIRTSSLPHTPNPFFRNYNMKDIHHSNITSGTATPGALSDPHGRDMHVRGPVDIVIGLEKKRQKRKEKFWRQHCRKAAKEQAERKPVPGRGAERMKELGLEMAERTKGYGLGQATQVVISL